MKRDQSSIDVLEHVVKGVHVESRGPHNHRVMPRPLDEINDDPPRFTRPRRRSGSQSRSTSSSARRAAK
ncbi:MAG: hypothetical protein ACREKH_20335 [Candidatus Rokuibacteriota bacterium]